MLLPNLSLWHKYHNFIVNRWACVLERKWLRYLTCRAEPGSNAIEKKFRVIYSMLKYKRFIWLKKVTYHFQPKKYINFSIGWITLEFSSIGLGPDRMVVYTKTRYFAKVCEYKHASANKPRNLLLKLEKTFCEFAVVCTILAVGILLIITID